MRDDGPQVLKMRLPTEFPPCLLTVGHQDSGIAWAVFLSLPGDGLAGDALHQCQILEALLGWADHDKGTPLLRAIW
jgi:hypothetical protein